MNSSHFKFVAVLALALSIGACKKEEAAPEKTEVDTVSALADLGRHLYFEKRLSADDTVSCNSCHNIVGGKSGTDNLPTSIGIKGQKGGRNAPTVWNAKFLSVQFWDGRAKDLAEQAKGPITNPIEMGMKDHDAAIAKIKAIQGYQDKFKQAFPNDPDPINIENLANAIAAFEETLEAIDSPFDRFQAGDQSAMSAKAKKGWDTFQKVGCTTCHSGEHFAGPKLPTGTGFYQKFPTYPGSKYDKKYALTKDPGRFEVTQKESDRNMWRVPTLRNIEKTGPYFHNGRVNSLKEAVMLMAKTQLNKDLKRAEAENLVEFLKALTSEVPMIEEPKPL